MFLSRFLGFDLLYCCKWRNILKSHYDLDLDWTMINIGLVEDIFILHNKFNFQGHLFLELSCLQTKTDTRIRVIIFFIVLYNVNVLQVY